MLKPTIWVSIVLTSTITTNNSLLVRTIRPKYAIRKQLRILPISGFISECQPSEQSTGGRDRLPLGPKESDSQRMVRNICE